MWAVFLGNEAYLYKVNAMKKLIKLVNGVPVVSTEVIATEFGRRHDNVMQNIRSLISSGHLGALDFKDSSYISKQNKEIACYELTERGFLIAMPFIGGEKAKDGQVVLVDSFIEFREKAKREAAIKAEREVARLEYRPMTDAIKRLKESGLTNTLPIVGGQGFTGFMTMFGESDDAGVIINLSQIAKLEYKIHCRDEVQVTRLDEEITMGSRLTNHRFNV